MVHPSQQKPRFSARRDAWSVTFTNGGRARVVRIRPWAAGLGAGIFALFLAAYVGATAYLVFRDDLFGTAITRQVAMQYSYEERIAALRAELDRATSRHAVHTESIEQQVSALREQQALIESRQATLDRIVQRAGAAGVALAAEAARAPRPRPDPAASETDGAEPGSVEPAAPGAPLAYAPSEPGPSDPIADTLIRKPGDAAPSGVGPQASAEEPLRPLLSGMQSTLDQVKTRQSSALDALDAAVEGESERLADALRPVGVAPAEDGEAEGGPYIPATGMHFVERAALLDRTIDTIAGMRHAAATLPLGVPVHLTRVTSRFGFRNDPFLHRPAFHAGLDFAAAQGAVVRSTAPGVVVSAGEDGGYGNMVEVRHANGVSTRYGHLSAILVKVGEHVSAGSPVGRVGSTGRSTGPHLHYETRRDGKPVNPATYLAAGRALREG